MILRDLIESLQEMLEQNPNLENAPVIVAFQPTWPLQVGLRGVCRMTEVYNPHEEYDEREDENEPIDPEWLRREDLSNGVTRDEEGNVVIEPIYIVASDHHPEPPMSPYASKMLWDVV